MKVLYQRGYHKAKELDVISIRSKFDGDQFYHILQCSNGEEVEATDFSYASGCIFKASLPENW